MVGSGHIRYYSTSTSSTSVLLRVSDSEIYSGDPTDPASPFVSIMAAAGTASAADTNTSSATDATATGGTFTLLLFAAASTYADGLELLTLPAPTTPARLFETLEQRFPGIKKRVLSSAALTVNLEYVEMEVDREGNVLRAVMEEGQGEGGSKGDGEVVIRVGDEVAVVPPVSSG